MAHTKGMKEVVRGLHGCSIQAGLVPLKACSWTVGDRACYNVMIHLGASACAYGEQSYLFSSEKLFQAVSTL